MAIQRFGVGVVRLPELGVREVESNTRRDALAVKHFDGKALGTKHEQRVSGFPDQREK